MARNIKSWTALIILALLLAQASCLSTPVIDNRTPTQAHTFLPLPFTTTSEPESLAAESATPILITPTALSVTPSAAESEPYLPFQHLSMINTEEGWAWGRTEDRKMRIWRTKDGGQSWIDVTPTSIVWDFGFALDSSTAWILICQSPSGYCEQTLSITEDGGTSWQIFPEPISASLPVFRFQSKTSGLLIEYDVGAGSGFYSFSETEDGGKTWDRVEIVSDPEVAITVFNDKLQTCNMCGDLIYIDQERLIVLAGNLNVTPSENILIWASLDRGASWHMTELEIPTGHGSSLVYHGYRPAFFEDGSGILAYELAGMHDDSSTMVFYTSRDGLNWQLISYVENAGEVDRWNELEILPNKEIFFVCGNNLCTTRDGALSWERISSNLNFNKADLYPKVYDFNFVDGQNGWALAGLDYDTFTLWQTTDGGKSWISLDPIFTTQ